MTEKKCQHSWVKDDDGMVRCAKCQLMFAPVMLRGLQA